MENINKLNIASKMHSANAEFKIVDSQIDPEFKDICDLAKVGDIVEVNNFCQRGIITKVKAEKITILSVCGEEKEIFSGLKSCNNFSKFVEFV